MRSAEVLKSKGERCTGCVVGYRNASTDAGYWSNWVVETVDKSTVFPIGDDYLSPQMMTITSASLGPAASSASSVSTQITEKTTIIFAMFNLICLSVRCFQVSSKVYIRQGERVFPVRILG